MYVHLFHVYISPILTVLLFVFRFLVLFLLGFVVFCVFWLLSLVCALVHGLIVYACFDPHPPRAVGLQAVRGRCRRARGIPPRLRRVAVPESAWDLSVAAGLPLRRSASSRPLRKPDIPCPVFFFTKLLKELATGLMELP